MDDKAFDARWELLKQQIERDSLPLYKELSLLGGGVKEGIFLSQAVRWHESEADATGWFTKTQEEWSQATTLSRAEQETVRRNLRERDLLLEARKGLPARYHYSLNWDVLFERIKELKRGGE